jgi:prepilin-type N-terminal cleavage/methylation domain-containing protein
MLNTNMTKQKGFTLIELMIVVAIIGILAAIAIPQFSAYRVKAFNSAAESDLRNMMTAEEATYADSQSYQPASGTIKDIGGSTTVGTTLKNLTGAKVSNNVGFAIVGANSGANYSIYTGHSKGDTEYAGDDAGLMRKKTNVTAPATTAEAESAQLTSSWGTGSL